MFIKKYLQHTPLLIGTGALAVIFLAYIVFFSSDTSPKYITAKVTRGNIEHTVLADGSIIAFKQVSVGAQVSGQIRKLYVVLGQKVKKGEMIAEIDDLTQENNLKQSEATLKSLEAQRAAKLAKRGNDKLTYERQRQLAQRNMTARAELDLAKSTLEATNADVESSNAEIVRAQIAVSKARLDLGYTRITAPMDGVIVAIPVEEGQTVNSVQSAPTIVKIAQLGKMTVKAQISEADVVQVKKGMPVYFSILGQPNHFYRNLTLRDIEPAPDSINADTTGVQNSGTNSNAAVYYNGLFDVDNGDGNLRISMTAQVYIVLGAAKNVLLIPNQALHYDTAGSNKAVVFTLNSRGKIIPKTVETGISDDMQSQIVSGLAENETVVVGGLTQDDKKIPLLQKPRRVARWTRH